MAHKLTKAAVKQLAKQHALAMPKPAYDAVAELTYEQLKLRARIEADLQVAQQGIANDVALAYVDAYSDAAVSVYGGVVRERERLRNEWRRMLTGLTAEQAVEKACELLRSFNVRGGEVNNRYSGATLTVKRGWGLEADVYVEFSRGYTDGLTNPDNDLQRVGAYEVSVKLNWGTMGSRSVQHAVAAAALYTELATLAAEAECVLGELRVIWTWGMDKPEAAAEPAADGRAPLKLEGLTGAADPRQSEVQ
jgi:hypothetical protein